MPVDTRNKRASAQGFLLAPQPLADSGIVAADRAQVAWTYAGLDYFVTAPNIGNRRGCEPSAPGSRAGLAPSAPGSRAGLAAATPGSRRSCP